MREVEATVVFEGEDWRPRRVHHLAPDLDWTVVEILDSWTHPGRQARTYGKPVVAQRHRLLVFGPLPGHPHENGLFVLVVTEYGDRDRWWMRPEKRRAQDSRAG